MLCLLDRTSRVGDAPNHERPRWAHCDDGGAPPPSDDAGAPPLSDDAGSPPQDDGGAGSDGSSDCSGYASPSTSASCTGCSSSDDCQANGCYGGYWCDPSSNCVDPSTVPCGQ